MTNRSNNWWNVNLHVWAYNLLLLLLLLNWLLWWQCSILHSLWRVRCWHLVFCWFFSNWRWGPWSYCWTNRLRFWGSGELWNRTFSSRGGSIVSVDMWTVVRCLLMFHVVSLQTVSVANTDNNVCYFSRNHAKNSCSNNSSLTLSLCTLHCRSYTVSHNSKVHAFIFLSATFRSTS